MGRTTLDLVEHRAQVVSRMLRGLRVEIQGRNGYFAADLYDGAGCVRTLDTGTKREIYDYLGGMLDALEMVGRDPS